METINSVADYLNQINSIERRCPSTIILKSGIFYRGQANNAWTMLPRLYRENLLPAESLLLTEIMHDYPKELPQNRFEALVKLQHFGMPTRLLDITSNPLVALYFACKSDENAGRDGVVCIFSNIPIVWSNDSVVELITDFIYNGYSQTVDIERWLKYAQNKYNNGFKGLSINAKEDLIRLLTIPALAVMPTKTNPRISAQDGAFFLCGMTYNKNDITSSVTRNRYVKFEPAKLESPQALFGKAQTVVIPSTSKANILEQLDIMGINEGKLFPDLPHQISHTVGVVKKELALYEK